MSSYSSDTTTRSRNLTATQTSVDGSKVWFGGKDYDKALEYYKQAVEIKEKILGKAIFTYYRKFRILEHGGWYEQDGSVSE